MVGEHPEPNVYHIRPFDGNAQRKLSTDANFKILVKPILEELLVLNLLKMGCKFPLLIPKQDWQDHLQICIIMPLT